jgi:hypothetical protein
MKKYIIAIVAIIVTITILVAYGNFLIYSDIVMGQELLSRHYGIAEWSLQQEDKTRKVRCDETWFSEVTTRTSPWCGYRLLVVEGIRYSECNDTDIVAALIPTKALPFWSIHSHFPPALVLHSNLSSYKMEVKDLPLKLGWR